MARNRTIPDATVLAAALDIVHDAGPAALSFGALAAATGLAGSTLVQRFGSRAALLRAALGLAWDRLDAATAVADARAADGPAGVVALLVALTGQYGEHDVADQLLVLREDLRDPVLRARGAAWIGALTAAIDRRLDDRPGNGALVVAHWQGTVTVWGFTRKGRLRTVVRRSLADLLDRIDVGPGSAMSPGPTRRQTS